MKNIYLVVESNQTAIGTLHQEIETLQKLQQLISGEEPGPGLKQICTSPVAIQVECNAARTLSTSDEVPGER